VIKKNGKEMVLIKAGWFEMGSTKQQMDAAYQLGKKYNTETKRAWFKSESPQHRVWVDAYYMDKTEVTNRNTGVRRGGSSSSRRRLLNLDTGVTPNLTSQTNQ
jgi:hypothetical protein